MRRVLFIAAILGLFLSVGGLVAIATDGMVWLLFFLILGATYLLFLLFFSERVLLRVLGATLVDSRIAPELFDIVSSSYPTMRIGVMPNASPNAFLLSGLSSCLVLTDEGLSSFSEDELRAAVTRMLSSRHAMLSTWIGVTGYLIGFPGFAFHGGSRSMGVTRLLDILLRPFAYLSSLFQGFFFSRALVFEDDRAGALRSERPDTLARVIMLCEGASRVKNPRRGNPSLSLLFLVNPYHGGLSAHFDFHPTAEKRTSKLNELSKKLGREIV